MTLFQYAFGYIWVMYVDLCNRTIIQAARYSKQLEISHQSPRILHFTRSSTHYEVHEAARLEGN